jgi:hypothetical protein
MTLSIDLPPATIQKLHAQAAASGKDVETLVREAVEVKLAVAGLSFRDIMAPVHEDFHTSGMTSEQVDSLIEETVQDSRSERKTSRTQQ